MIEPRDGGAVLTAYAVQCGWSASGVGRRSGRGLRRNWPRATGSARRCWPRCPATLRSPLAAIKAEVACVTDTLKIDFDQHLVFREKDQVHLTPTEWHIVDVLTRQPSTLVRQVDLLRQVWRAGYSRETNYLRVSVPAPPENGLGCRFQP